MYSETLAAYLGRQLTQDESALMDRELDFVPGGLSDETLSVAEQLSKTIAARHEELRALPIQEQAKHLQSVRRMLSAMEGFYLFGGPSYVEKNGVRATHPWGAVLLPLYGVFDQLEDLHRRLAIREMSVLEFGDPNASAANARWSKLDDAKQLAFDLHQQAREQNPKISRAASIRRMVPKILDACRSAGEPLTGMTPEQTIEGWFKKAGIK